MRGRAGGACEKIGGVVREGGKNGKGVVLLSFDVEEFDLPREHGAEISLEEGVKVSAEGLEKRQRTTQRSAKKC